MLVDPFDGMNDLKKGIIRTPLDPDITFSDDPLRMMRAIRFATQLNFHIEKETFAAIERNRNESKSFRKNASSTNSANHTFGYSLSGIYFIRRL